MIVLELPVAALDDDDYFGYDVRGRVLGMGGSLRRFCSCFCVEH